MTGNPHTTDVDQIVAALKAEYPGVSVAGERGVFYTTFIVGQHEITFSTAFPDPALWLVLEQFERASPDACQVKTA